MSGMSVLSFPYTMMGEVFKVMNITVHSESRAMFVLNAVQPFAALFKACSWFLPESVLQKVQVSSTN